MGGAGEAWDRGEGRRERRETGGHEGRQRHTESSREKQRQGQRKREKERKRQTGITALYNLLITHEKKKKKKLEHLGS